MVEGKHKHGHIHDGIEHSHEHVHDEHHGHTHELQTRGTHRHVHKHVAIRHAHEHVHDEHHPHGYLHLPEIDKYAHLESPLHSLDPRLKLVSMGLLIISIVLVSHIWLALIGLCFALALVSVSRIPLFFVVEDLKWVFLFVSFFLVIMPLTVPGTVMAKFYFVSISLEGIRLGSLIAIKAIAAILVIFPMIGTMRFDITIKALEKLKLPQKLVQMIMFTYRYIFVFIHEAQRMATAMDSRGFQRKTNLYTLKTYSNLVGMLFVRSYERTERVYHAMVSRGYDGNLRTLVEFNMCKKDVLKAIAIGTLAMVLTCLEIIS
jgi:cobalt/nickel transport system permease protein